FFMALGYWLFHGVPFGNRLLSLACHLGVVALFYLNLVLFNWRSKTNIPSAIISFITLAYGLAPIHSETIAVAQFRGEILGSLFALAAMGLVQWASDVKLHRARKFCLWFAIFLVWGFSQLSKEVFAFLLPIALFLLWKNP